MLPLPISIRDFNDQILAQALALLPSSMGALAARVQLATIAMQESNLSHRWQVVDLSKPEAMGPARGLLQFEKGGGVRGVLSHPASQNLAAVVCARRGVLPTESDVYGALHKDDVLAVAFGRLLLWTDPRAMPAAEDIDGGWQLYLRTWRPGAYERDPIGLRNKWGRNRRLVLAELAP